PARQRYRPAWRTQPLTAADCPTLPVSRYPPQRSSFLPIAGTPPQMTIVFATSLSPELCPDTVGGNGEWRRTITRRHCVFLGQLSCDNGYITDIFCCDRRSSRLVGSSTKAISPEISTAARAVSSRTSWPASSADWLSATASASASSASSAL